MTQRRSTSIRYSAPTPSITPPTRTDLGDFIAHGTFGYVFKYSENSIEYAVKIIFPRTRNINSIEFQMFRQEAEISNFLSRDVDHFVKTINYATGDYDETEVNLLLSRTPDTAFNAELRRNILALFMSDSTPIPVIFITMELCGPNLQDWLNDNDRKFDSKQNDQINILYHLLRAVSYLHGKDYCHRDIKPSNICFSNGGWKEYRFPIKLGDFGFAKHNLQHSLGVRLVGTEIYMAPEVGNGNYDGTRADIYSLGLVLWEVLQDFQELEKKEKFERLRKGEVHLVENHSVLSNSRDVIIQMTMEDPNLRISNIKQVKFGRNAEPSIVSTSEDLDMHLTLYAKNNENIILGTGLYEGTFVLNHDNVSLLGSTTGLNRTVIKGQVLITGSYCTVSGISFIGGSGMMQIGENCKRTTLQSLDFQGGDNALICLGDNNSFEDIKFSGSIKLGVFITGNQNIFKNLTMVDVECGVRLNASENEFSSIKYTKTQSKEQDMIVIFDFKKGKYNTIRDFKCYGLKENDFGIVFSKDCMGTTICSSQFHSIKLGGKLHRICNRIGPWCANVNGDKTFRSTASCPC